jgi:hypothetical protein
MPEPTYGGYPPGPGPSSSSYQRRDTMMSTGSGSESVTPHPSALHGRSLSMSVNGSGSLIGATPDMVDTKPTGKKKRKKGGPAGETDKEKEKRTKTGRACDACVRFFLL